MRMTRVVLEIEGQGSAIDNATVSESLVFLWSVREEIDGQ
jgi:hypothetical protein